MLLCRHCMSWNRLCVCNVCVVKLVSFLSLLFLILRPIPPPYYSAPNKQGNTEGDTLTPSCHLFLSTGYCHDVYFCLSHPFKNAFPSSCVPCVVCVMVPASFSFLISSFSISSPIHPRVGEKEKKTETASQIDREKGSIFRGSRRKYTREDAKEEEGLHQIWIQITREEKKLQVLSREEEFACLHVHVNEQDGWIEE